MSCHSTPIGKVRSVTQSNRETNRSRFLVYPQVFWPSVGLILTLLIFAVAATNLANQFFADLNAFLTNSVGWWYILAVTGFLLVVLVLAFSRYGRIKLGGPDDKPEFSNMSWFAMLFSAGMGIGLVFYGVAEPLSHYGDPPRGVEPETIQSANEAMRLTYFHWGLHAWAVYAVVGLGLAYVHFRRGRPLAPRYMLEPLLGEKVVRGGWGHAVDIVAIVGTVFGVATSLGLGVQQISRGLEFLGIAQVTTASQIVIIIVVTGLATLSVATGLDKGIKLLSNFNLGLAALLALFVLLAGGTVFILDTWVQSIGGYFSNFLSLSLRTDAFQNQEWIGAWTIFYWGWWISWAPFVGMFIARISRGRTIRQFVLGVLVAPLVVTTIWFAIFGGAGLNIELNGEGGLVETVQQNIDVAIFAMFDDLPLTSLLSVITILIVATFFVTSADSGSLVIDTIASGGQTHTPRLQRMLWASLLGVVAIVLLVSGGLIALQTATIATAFPFSIIIVLTCASLLKALKEDAPGRRWRKPKRADIDNQMDPEALNIRAAP